MGQKKTREAQKYRLCMTVAVNESRRGEKVAVHKETCENNVPLLGLQAADLSSSAPQSLGGPV